MKNVKDKVKLNAISHTVRTAQAVLQYGVGAMVDFPDQTLMTAAPEFWDDKIKIIHDERLEKALKVTYFGMPGGKDDFKEGISYVRFPQWYFCPECRTFQPIDDWLKEYKKHAPPYLREKYPYMDKPKCYRHGNKGRDLVVTRIVVVCEHGHINDFPWIEWVHAKNRSGKKQICDCPQLLFKTGAVSSSGLEGLTVECKTCKASANLLGAFGKEEGKNPFETLGDGGYFCSGYQPWKNEHEPCALHPKTIQCGASSAYFPKEVSSLVIPPYSDKLNVKIENSEEYRKCQNRIEDLDDDERDERIRKKLEEWADAIARQIAVDTAIVKGILTRRWLDATPTEYTTDSDGYRWEEYKALTGAVSYSDLDSADFIREEMDIAEYPIYGLKSISLVHKVREVRALTGFTRLNSPGSSDLGVNDPNFVSVKEPATKWYPAYEVRGEGIFIELSESIIEKWIASNPILFERVKEINDNYRNTYQGQIIGRNITPKFLFLHSMAHLLINQLSFECGYTAASLRERLYCSDAEGMMMAGILIYTASGASEGTLGGLVRQGYSDSLPAIYSKAVDAGRMCSNDPVCISSQGQGRDSLNLAACHACLLLPETSCEEFNVFLDRGMVVGTFAEPNIGFYSQQK